MNGYFSSEPAKYRLEESIKSWMHTPWAAYSCVKHGGVSCHQLCIAIYQECGVLPLGLEIPFRGFSSQHIPQAAGWVDSRPEFAALEERLFNSGDLILFHGDRLHFAIVCTDGIEIVQCLGKYGVHRHGIFDANVLSRIYAMWRPMKAYAQETTHAADAASTG